MIVDGQFYFIIYALNDDVNEADDVIVNEHEHAYDIGKASGFCANLRIVEIPDDYTDYYINEYDGAETLIYVKDGKLHWA